MEIEIKSKNNEMKVVADKGSAGYSFTPRELIENTVTQFLRLAGETLTTPTTEKE